MARGWESKSVESQQSERDWVEQRPRRAAEEVEAEKRRESLERSRRRIARELESARSAVHRTALENALKHLDEELARLAGPPTPA